MKPSLLALSFIAALALAIPAAAVDLSVSPEEIEAEKAHWIERLTESQSQLANAKARFAQAQTTYQRMRTRSSSRGDKRSLVTAELRAAETALADAEANLESTLDDARREGVPPGWIRDANSHRNAAPAARN